MKKLFFLFLVMYATQTLAQTDPYMGIIPAPVSVIRKTQVAFEFSKETRFIVSNNSEAKYLNTYLHEMGYPNTVAVESAGKLQHDIFGSAIVFESKEDGSIPSEEYRMVIEPNRIIVVGGKESGTFYGMQSLLQLLPPAKAEKSAIPCGLIRDYPRFAYRGMHLDVSRHFFSVDFIKKYLDVMAMYKLNYFHWHLTDDQGWRIEIKKYPKLTSVGSKRAQTKVGAYGYNDLYDGMPYEGYYTQEQIREVVAYAAERHITIVPEIEMPGHSRAALSAYPEMSCDPSKTYEVAQTWGGYKDVYCPSETTFKILEDVLTEVMELFPGKYIHIGGDECDKDAWKASAFCQQLIKDSSLKDEEGLQSYFIRRMERFLNSKGRRIIGWDEILEGGLAPNATVMSWRGEQGGIAAAQEGHDVIMTPGSGGLYFDHAQSKSTQEPLNIGGNAPLSKTYSYDPVPASLTPEQQKHVIGVQANLWTEYISTEAKAEYMLLPRMLALAEVAWSPKENKDYKNFSEQRIPTHLQRLEKKGYNYRVPVAIGAEDSIRTGSEIKIELKTLVAGAKIHYTLDEHEPTETDMIYTEPFTLPIPKGKEVILKTIVITEGGRRSISTRTVLSNK